MRSCMALHCSDFRYRFKSGVAKSATDVAFSPRYGRNMFAAKWVREALAHSGLSGAELARRLTDELRRPIDRAAVQKMQIVRTKGTTKARAVKADEMMAIARITGYPVPDEVKGDGDASIRARDMPPVEGQIQVDEPDTRAGGGWTGHTPLIEAEYRDGGIYEAEAVRDVWGLPKKFLHGQLSIYGTPVIFEVFGDSMYDPADPGAPGSLFPGDRVIVDQGDRTPSPPGHFLVFDGHGLVVKMVEVVREKGDAGRIRLLSRNPRYQPYEATEDEAQIIGRVRGRISVM